MKDGKLPSIFLVVHRDGASVSLGDYYEDRKMAEVELVISDGDDVQVVEYRAVAPKPKRRGKG